MGFFSKIGKGIKKVGSKIVGGINKIGDALTGGNWSKWMEKGWVQKAMMAATLLTGGIAIVNGAMTGWGAATSTAGDFATKFVAGSKGFVEGLASGLTNPVGTGKELLGKAGEAMGIGQGAGGAASGVAESAGAAMPTSSPIQTALNTTEQSLVAPMSAAPNPAFDMLGAGADTSAFAGDALAKQVAGAAAPAAEKGWLESLKSGAKDFASSPMGMQTAASAVSGWAQGQAMEEQWNRMDDERKRKRETWTGFASRAPQFNMDSLQNLRDRRTQMYDRGDIAQGKFGY